MRHISGGGRRGSRSAQGVKCVRGRDARSYNDTVWYGFFCCARLSLVLKPRQAGKAGRCPSAGSWKLELNFFNQFEQNFLNDAIDFNKIFSIFPIINYITNTEIYIPLNFEVSMNSYSPYDMPKTALNFQAGPHNGPQPHNSKLLSSVYTSLVLPCSSRFHQGKVACIAQHNQHSRYAR